MRVPVELRRFYRLLNHGPTTIITTAAAGRRDIMAAAWVMPLAFTPVARIAAVIAEGTFTRELVEASGELVVNIPTAAQAALSYAVGKRSGREVDKFAAHQVEVEPASLVQAPLVVGCAGWLECRALAETDLARRHDLFLLDVVAAWADDRLFQGGELSFPSPDSRTIHHLSAGVFFTTGERIDVSGGRRGPT